MENILVVIRDEIRKNREVLEEIRDLLKDHGRQFDALKPREQKVSKTQEQLANRDDKAR